MISSYSTQRTFLRCPKKFEYTYLQRLRPVQTDSRFLLGSAVHSFLEIYYRSIAQGATREDAYEAGLLSLQEYLQEHMPQSDRDEDMVQLATGMVKHYHAYATEHDRFTPLETEVPWKVNLANGDTLMGKFDGLVLEGNEIWILEHKTAATINTSHVSRDKQVSVYCLIAQTSGIPVAGVIYNTLRKALPAAPKPLKKGGLSRSLGPNLTYASYIQAIRENGLRLEDYAEELAVLKERENTFFDRQYVRRPEGSLETVANDLLATQLSMAAYAKIKWYPRNDTKDCSWDCPFVELCQLELDGGDATHLRETAFTVAPGEALPEFEGGN